MILTATVSVPRRTLKKKVRGIKPKVVAKAASVKLNTVKKEGKDPHGHKNVKNQTKRRSRSVDDEVLEARSQSSDCMKQRRSTCGRERHEQRGQRRTPCRDNIHRRRGLALLHFVRFKSSAVRLG